MLNTNELIHCIKGNVFLTKPHATKKVPFTGARITYYFIKYLIQCTKSTLKPFFEHPPEQEIRYTSFKDDNTPKHDTGDEWDLYRRPFIRANC